MKTSKRISRTWRLILLLLERVAERIAQVLLAADDRIEGTTVTVRKLRPPIPADLVTSGVTITRYR